MPIKSRRVNLSIHPNKESRIIDAGRKNRMQTVGGDLNVTTICTKIVYFFLDLHADDEIRRYLDKHGGTLFDLIIKAIKKYISDEN